MLSSPPLTRHRLRIIPDPHVLDQALPQPDQARDTDDDGNNILSSASSIRFIGARTTRGEEHAQRDEEIPKHLGVRRKDISQQNISKFPILRLCDATDGYALQGSEKAVTTIGGQPLVGDEEGQEKEEEVRLGYDIPGEDIGCAAASEGPEEEEREDEREGNGCCKGVGALMVGQGGGGAGWVFNEGGNILQSN